MPRSRAVALVLVPLASAIGLAAQTPLQDAVSRCGVIGAPAQRLACYDSLAKVPARPSTIPAGVGAWQVSDEKNPLDDSRTVVLSLAATSGRSVHGQPVALALRCMSNKATVYVMWNSYLGDEARVTFRVGGGESRTKTWSVSTDKTATFYPSDHVEFMKEIMAADRLVLQVTPYNESPITAVFDLAGLPNAIKPLREDCGW